jgi:isopropylmalate/homocitrate/citramalate synthase
MELSEIFTTEELADAREALAEFRPAGAYEPGKWMVNPLNRSVGTATGRFPPRVRLRDITLRTSEQMPGLVNTTAERLELAQAMAQARVPEIAMSMFRRGHTLEEMRAEVKAVKSIAPETKLIYDNAVRREELELAAEAGIDGVDVWSAVYLGKAMKLTAGAVYHRAWQGREWRDLNFPPSPEEHVKRAQRLIRIGVDLGLRMSSAINLLAFASEDYITLHCKAVAEAGATEVVLMDSSGATSPEAMARIVEVALEAAPGLSVGVHCHNMYGLAIANSLVAARAGADLIEVAVNGYEVGPAGCQASLAGTAAALEVLYGVNTGIDLSQLTELTDIAARMVGWPTTWNEPVLGSGILLHSSGDEYEQEEKFDPLVHGSLHFEVVGAKQRREIGKSTGPMNMSDKLTELGINANKEQTEAILAECKTQMMAVRRSLTDSEIMQIANSILAA